MMLLTRVTIHLGAMWIIHFDSLDYYIFLVQYQKTFYGTHLHRIKQSLKVKNCKDFIKFRLGLKLSLEHLPSMCEFLIPNPNTLSPHPHTLANTQTHTHVRMFNHLNSKSLLAI